MCALLVSALSQATKVASVCNKSNIVGKKGTAKEGLRGRRRIFQASSPDEAQRNSGCSLTVEFPKSPILLSIQDAAVASKRSYLASVMSIARSEPATRYAYRDVGGRTMQEPKSSEQKRHLINGVRLNQWGQTRLICRVC